jgi:hypothetical protein
MGRLVEQGVTASLQLSGRACVHVDAQQAKGGEVSEGLVILEIRIQPG